MLIPRIALNHIKKKVTPGKVVILTGARRVGKTFLISQYLKSLNEKYILWNGEDFAVHDLLKRRSVQHYKNILGDTKFLVIDEVQKIPDIGNVLKLIVDNFQDLKVLVSGSSAFDISNETGEPLTGRKKEITLFPISESELRPLENPQERFDNLCLRLVFGNMPEIFSLSSIKDKAEYLREIVNSYLLKDILAFESLRNSDKLFALLKLVALQIGKEVSLQELGRQLAMSKNTIERYLDILSKVFIIYKLTGFSRNLRKEIVKNSKWYFYDNGIRNAILANFNLINNREDIGMLWENYMMSERLKYNHYNEVIYNKYFWRTYDKQEIDLIEEKGGKLYAFEFKWKPAKIKIPTAWKTSYPDSEFNQVNSENYFDWV
ncbi:MAG: ATP-binding protein [Ignavibacterium sp.]|uniref:ATP-binding protein n=1 Tax=Ignavibacterium album TaxID=591197 RepID=A0A7V3E666_9BACT|nr:ATP-binding protein [Ignavibacterium sp.]